MMREERQSTLEKSIEIPVVQLALVQPLKDHICGVCGESVCINCLTKDVFWDSRCLLCGGDNFVKLSPSMLCHTCSIIPEEKDNYWRNHLICEIMERVSLEQMYQGRGRKKKWISLERGKPVSSTEILFVREVRDIINTSNRSCWPIHWRQALISIGQPMFSADRLKEIEKHFFILKCTYVHHRFISTIGLGNH
jgi:hypothetical protein